MRIKNASILTSHGNIKGRQDIIQILKAGLQAGEPYTNAKKLLRLEGDTLLFIEVMLHGRCTSLIQIAYRHNRPRIENPCKLFYMPL